MKMDKEKAIEKITKGESLKDSVELLGWVNQSKDNQETYIRYKNLWALLQQGKEMTPEQVEQGIQDIKKRMRKSNNRFKLTNILKYAAIIVFAFIGGSLMGFGAKLARGCTSGQGLTGGALLSVGGWAFMMAVFAGAYAFAYFVRRQWT